MCLCDLLLSSTLHYRKIHTLTQQIWDSKWTEENISDQSFFLPSCLLRLHINLSQRGTRESLSRLLTQFLFLCCSVFPYLWLITSYKHSPLQTQAHGSVAANEYVTWQLVSGSLRFLAWFVSDSRSALTKFDLVVWVRKRARTSPSMSSLLPFLSFSSFFPVSDHFPTLHHTSVKYPRYHLTPQPFLSRLMNIKATNLLYMWKDILLLQAAAGFVRAISIYRTSLSTQLSFFDIWTQCEPLSYPPALATGNLLVCSHSPTITEAYKLPQGTIPDPLVFSAPAPKSLSHPLWRRCLCGTI